MKILQEITEWEDNTPNHIYHIDDKGKLVAYQKFGSDEVTTFKSGLSFDRSRRKFITIKSYPDELTSRQVRIKDYIIDLDHKTCTCSGFKFRGACKHVAMAMVQ